MSKTIAPGARQLKKGGDFTIIATLDATGLQSALQRLQEVSKKDMEVLVKQSARRIGVDLAIRTFPRKFEQGRGTIDRDTRLIYPSRSNIKSILEKTKKDAGKIFFSILKRNPQSAVRYAESIGVKIEMPSSVKEETVKNAVSFRTSSKGTRSTSVIKYDGPILMIKGDRDAQIERYVRRVSKRVGTVAGGWVEASKSFGALRYDGRDAQLDKFKRSRRPMIVGRGKILTTGARHVATLTNLVDYSDKCIPSQALAYAVEQEKGNLRLQAEHVLKRETDKIINAENRRKAVASRL